MMHFQAQENNSQHSDFTVDNHTGIRYHKDMENTQTAYTEADKETFRILRAAYMESDLLANLDVLLEADSDGMSLEDDDRAIVEDIRRRWMEAMKTKEKA